MLRQYKAFGQKAYRPTGNRRSKSNDLVIDGCHHECSMVDEVPKPRCDAEHRQCSPLRRIRVCGSQPYMMDGIDIGARSGAVL
jgi:hypothetical protein